MNHSARPPNPTATATAPDFRAGGPHAIGIDVGGTKIAGALVNLETGALAARRQIPTNCRRGGEAVFADVESLARALLDDAGRLGVSPRRLGVGVAELVDPQGRVFSDYRIAWKNIPVQDRLSAILPATVSSDVRAAALAEARYGHGRGLSDFYFVTIGTGVSGVLVIKGVPYPGSRGAALVITTGPSRHHCANCGHTDNRSVEDIASGPGLVAAFHAARTAEDVVAAAHGGDPAAVRVIDHAAGELGRVLAVLAGGLDPEAIIVGGGLGTAPGLYFDRVVAATRAGLWESGDHILPILQAASGPDAGLIGAAAATHPKPELTNQPDPAT